MEAITHTKRSNEELLQIIKETIGVQVPVEVVDYEKYYEYLKLERNPIHSLKVQVGSKELPITHPIPVFNKAIQKALDNDEIDQERADKIKQMKGSQQKIKLKAMSVLKEAYGTNVNFKGQVVKMKTIFDPVKEQMIELFGRMFTAVEVHEVCLKTWKLNATIVQVNDFRRAHLVEINKKIEEHKRTYSDIRLGHKRSRLEELVWMYNKRKGIYQITNKGEDHRLLLTTLEQIRKEAEGDALRIDGNINFGLDVTIQNHIHKDLVKSTPLKEIVLARIAAKTNTDPTKLLNYLQKSIYRQILDAETVEFEDMPQYPSTQNYDFDMIRRVQQQNEQEKLIEAKIIPTVDAKVENEGNMLKQLMLKKLSQNQGDVNREKNNLSLEYKD